MMFGHAEKFEVRTLNYMYIQNSREREVFEEIFSDVMMSSQELNSGLNLLWDSEKADKGFGDIFD